MQSYRPVNALSMCAAVLVLSGGETQAFMVGRRNNFDVRQAIGMRSKDEAAAPQASFSLYDTDERQLQLHPALFAFDGTREASFVQSSGDDDSDDDSDDEDDKQGGKEKSKAEKKKGDKASGHEGKESHGHHGEHDNASKGKPDKEDEEKAEHKEEAAEHKRESAAPASPKGEQHEDEEDEDRKKERKKEEPTKSESLLTSPQEQSKFIMASMKKATDESVSELNSCNDPSLDCSRWCTSSCLVFDMETFRRFIWLVVSYSYYFINIASRRCLFLWLSITRWRNS